MWFAIGMVLVFCVVVPFFGVSVHYSDIDLAPMASQYFGLVGLLMMSWCHLLATRLSVLEWCFKGLDKSYWVHKWLGIGALAALLLHNQIDAEIESLRGGSFADLGEELGEIGFDALQVLLFITVVLIIPYALWKFTHKFMGVITILSTLHFIWMPKPFDVLSPFGLYILSFCLLAVVSYVYNLIGIMRVQKPLPYTLESIEQPPGFLVLELRPQDKSIVYKAGQFSFISFDHPKLKESHPFSISTAPLANGKVRFSIKVMGDGTRSLQQYLEAGMTAHISKGFGHFGRHLSNFGSAKKQKEELWIASGVGVTPFVALAQSLTQQHLLKTTLVYCLKDRTSALHLDELESIASQNDFFELILVESSVSGRFTLDKLDSLATFDMKKLDVLFCGPVAMRKTLQKELSQRGVRKNRFHYEVFEIRSGIGITPIIQWILNQLLQRFPVIGRVWDTIDKKLISRLPIN